MQILVFSEEKMKRFRTDKRYAVISIQDPTCPFIKLSRPKNCLGISRFKFYDFDRPTGQTNYDTWLFMESEADQILKFFDMVRNKVDILCINCVAGVSRSAGVAAALSKIYCGDDFEFFKRYTPNSLVYRTILNQYYGKETKEENAG